MAEIYRTYSLMSEEDGHEWYYINGDAGYDLTSGWTKEEAEKHYLSEEGEFERTLSEMEAYGFYD